MPNEIMDASSSEISANYVYNTLLQDRAHCLKSLLKDIEGDYDNLSYDYILRQCKNVKGLENYLKDYSHLFIVENGKVARYSEKLENGQEAANRYFEENLKHHHDSVSVETLRKHMEDAPEDIQCFIQTFYPESEFKRYLSRRPLMFYVSHGNVRLIEKVSVEFFRKIVKQGEGIQFTSLRGNIGQASEHIRKYINDQYPGTEFRYFLDKNCDVFQVNSNGRVFLVK